METARGRRVIARVSEVVGLVGGGHPHAGLRAVVEHDLLGQHEAEIVLEEFPVRLDVHRQAASSGIGISKRERKCAISASLSFFCWWEMLRPSPASPSP